MRFPDETKFSGCLIGQCLGDALGFPVEGHLPSVCHNYTYQKMTAWLDEPDHQDLALIGQYTDDSQLAREFLQSYGECKGFDPENYARRIADIFRENRIVGRGFATDAAAGRLANGVPWKEAGCPPPAAGNGTAMRAGPVGLICFDDALQMIQVARDQSWITHQDPRCLAGSVAIAGAVALALKGQPISTYDFLEQLAEWIEPTDQSFSDLICQLKDWISFPPSEAVKFIAPAGRSPDYIEHWPGISPFVVGSVLWSLYSFLRTPDDYWESICTAIAVGGDVDTTAAMTGAISGAHLGLDALPVHLTEHLNDRGTWSYRELVDLAHCCHRIKKQQMQSY